jgi:GMP synthase-like glutamine amidotransferase
MGAVTSSDGAAAERTILAVIHQTNGGPGHFAPVIEAAGYRLEIASFALDQVPESPLSSYAAVMVFGAWEQVDQEEQYEWLVAEKRAVKEALDEDVPLLGICFGGQLVADVAGAWVGPVRHQQLTGWNQVVISPEAAADPVVGGLPASLTTVVWHKYEFELPPGATPLARSVGALQAFRVASRPAWGLQFHIEASGEDVEGWLREAVARGELDESALPGHLTETKRRSAQQKELGERLCERFLRVVEAGGDRRV